MTLAETLFSESNTRFVAEVSPENVEKFEQVEKVEKVENNNEENEEDIPEEEKLEE